MACFVNEAQGARSIRLTGKSCVLLDPGQSAEIPLSRVVWVPPGVAVDEGKPTVSAAAASGTFDHDGDGKPGGSKAPPPSDDIRAVRAEYQLYMHKRPFPGWDVAEMRRRMDEEARHRAGDA